MQGVVIHCPNQECKKPLMKEVFLAPGSRLKTKCYWCGHSVEVIADNKRISLRDLSVVEKYDSPITII